jgi:hypothetical protein
MAIVMSHAHQLHWHAPTEGIPIACNTWQVLQHFCKPTLEPAIETNNSAAESSTASTTNNEEEDQPSQEFITTCTIPSAPTMPTKPTPVNLWDFDDDTLALISPVGGPPLTEIKGL